MTQRPIFRPLSRPLKILALSVAFAVFATAPQVASAQSGAPAAPAKQPRRHGNHRPQHGGLFFMALDNSHHLEGVLDRSNTFRLYLYDAYTRPLKPAQVKLAEGTLQVGDAEDAPKIPLVLGPGGLYLQAALGPSLSLPVKLNVSLRLPGAAPSARPEIFTFPFSHYIAGGAQSAPPATSVPSGHTESHTGMELSM